jgi:beta-xylosidase
LALNCPFRVYSSPDLERWTYEGELLKDQTRGVYTRPCVVFNPHTHKYVLWYNWFPKLWNGQTAVAISDMPVGPFKIANPNVQLSHPGTGDGSLFVDDDGAGYYIYTSMGDGYAVRVEHLKPDYLGPSGKTSNILAKGAEAPVLFRRNNLYYALCGPLCPDCPEGSMVQVFTSTSPLGPFTPRSNINHRPENGAPIIPAQETWVARIPMSGEPLFIWMADRWGSCPDGVKGHDFQFWSAPLKFSPDGDILPIENIGRWDITWAWGD